MHSVEVDLDLLSIMNIDYWYAFLREIVKVWYCILHHVKFSNKFVDLVDEFSINENFFHLESF